MGKFDPKWLSDGKLELEVCILFVDGMDIDLRAREAKKPRLQPLDYKIREIHECSRQTQWARSWPHIYYGLEPLVQSGDWKTRYATIFTR